jgi:hypothetical protein
VRRHGAEASLATELHARLDEAKSVPEPYRDRLRTLVDRATDRARVAARDPAGEREARAVTSALYHAATAVTLAWEGAAIHDARGDARRLVLSRLVVEHRLSPRDPLAPGDGRLEDAAATLVLEAQPVPLEDAAALSLA